MVGKRERHSEAWIWRRTHRVDCNGVRANEAFVIEFSEAAKLLLRGYFEDRTSLAIQLRGWMCMYFHVSPSL